MNFKQILLFIVIQFFLIQSAFATTARELFENGQQLAHQGKHYEAIKLFERTLEGKLDNNYHISLVYYNIGLSYSKLGDRAKSIPSYTASFRYYQRYPLSFLNRGNDYRIEGKILKAIKDFNKATTLDDKLFFASNNRALAYLDIYVDALHPPLRSLLIRHQSAKMERNYGLGYHSG